MDGHANFQLASLCKLTKKSSESFLHLHLPGQETDVPIRKRSFVDSANAVLDQSSLPPNCNSQKWAKGHWDSNSWTWDSVSFLAKPNGKCLTINEPEQLHDSENLIKVDGMWDHSEDSLGILQLGMNEFETMGDPSSKLKRKQSFNASRHHLDMVKPNLRDSSSGKNVGSLTLNLGGMPYAEDSDHRSNKRNRPSSPGKGYPMCQVDNCQANLMDAKDYHRRHKVCEIHFKSTEALMNQIMQRFCQQCSRFHPIEEFDNEKRSCRRRLAGHNRRRRRTRFEDVASKQLIQEESEQTLNKLDIVRLIEILSKIQGDRLVGRSNMDCNYILQCLKTVSAISPKVETRVDGLSNMHDKPEMDAKMHSLQTNGYQSSQLSASLHSILSAFAGCPSDALAVLLRIVSRDYNSPMMHASSELSTNQNLQSRNLNYFYKSGIDTEKSVSAVANGSVKPYPSASSILHNLSPVSGQISSSFGGKTHHFTENIGDLVDERHQSLGPSSVLQLSPPVERNLLPFSDKAKTVNKTIPTSSAYKLENKLISSNENASTYTLIGSVSKNNAPSYLSRCSNEGKPLQQVRSNCLYGPNETPCSNFQERTGRIVFKLFGKDPGDFPLALRTQIIEWLSQSPSDIESYIRPGCVILSIYLSMPFCAWEQLDNGLQERLEHLVASDEGGFWRTGRILVQVKQKLAFFKDGKIRLSKTLRPLNVPELYSVWPIAIVAGEDTTLVLRGRNLNIPGTKFLCAYRGKYTFESALERVEETDFLASMTYEQTKQMFKFSGGPANVLGRCFIEVEHSLKGNIFPIIVADSAICLELRSLELEIDDLAMSLGSTDVESFGDLMLGNVQLGVKMETLCFLNELGWLFQRSNWQTEYCGNLPTPKFTVSRFRGLLIYAVEHDWCALMKRLLDLFFIMNVGQEGLTHGAIENLLEANLLHRAVKRNCRKMVDFLLNYLPPPIHTRESENSFTFSPDMAGPFGLTPLHIAASMQNAEGMVDALTSHPHEVGLYAWSSTLDSSQKTPETYAMLKNNLSYIHMIQRKFSDKRNPQAVITVWDAKAYSGGPTRVGKTGAIASGIWLTQFPLKPSCAQRSEMTTRRVRQITSIHGSLYRPFCFSFLFIAAVCVCVCLILKGPPQVASVSPFKWENVDFGLF